MSGSAQPLVGVLALQGDVREHLAALRAAGARAQPVRRPAELAEVDGLVLPGGESTTMSRLLDTFELLTPLRSRLGEGMPAYGSCAGMILLAKEVRDGRPDQHQLGALDMVVRRNAFGRQVDSFEEDLDFADVPDGPVHAVFIRAPWVEKVGDGVSVLGRVPMSGPVIRVGTVASTEHPPVGDVPDAAAGRIVAVRQGNLLATSFHPEITGDLRVHRYFVELVRAAQL